MKDLKRAACQWMLAWKQCAEHKALEVSGARQVGETDLVEKGKTDALLLAKGITRGGIADRGYTMPVYGISKLNFSD